MPKFLENRDFEEIELNKPLIPKEIKEVFKHLKVNKAPGPDNLLNEFIQKGGKELQETLINIFIEIFNTEQIPKDWNKTNIISIYKDKGNIEDLKNHRGISLSSNILKIFEKVINNRITKILPFTDLQAGGREKFSSNDQSFILNSIIQQSIEDNKPLYIAYIDISKAYDKTWGPAVFYNLWNKGIRGKIWRLMYKLNENSEANILTRFGMTDTVEISGSLKQGSVLSVSEFSNLLDDINRVLLQEGLGVCYGDITIPSLIFMDDVVIMENNSVNFKKELQLVENFRKKCRFKFSETKTKIMIINKREDPKNMWKIGEMETSICTDYNYLGQIVQSNGSLDKHLEQKRNSIAYKIRDIKCLVKDSVMNKMNSNIIIQLYKSCILPSLLFGAETWNITSKQIQLLEKIQYDSIRQLFKLPQGTPLPALLGETGLIYIEDIIFQRQINFLHRIINIEGKRLIKDVMYNQIKYYKYNNCSWVAKLINTLNKYDITLNDLLNTNRLQWKCIVNNAVLNQSNKKFIEEAQKRKKLHQIIKYKKEIKLEKYFSDLSVSHARTIFLLRTRMLALKCNQKSQYGENIICPRCGKGDDNEFHLLYECEANKEKIQINLENIMRTENIDKEELQSVAQIIQETLN